MAIRRRLMVFISSTYMDLVEERQAAVKAVLKAGHIPAGMELFAAGDKAQFEIIKKWIQDSDALMLLLGGRYGSIEPESGKSYTEQEYLYAVRHDIPVFALVMKDDLLEMKRAQGVSLETDNPNYLAFKEQVLARMCSFFDDLKDIEIGALGSLIDLERRDGNRGWISAKDVSNYDRLLVLNEDLTSRNLALQRELQNLKAVRRSEISMAEHSFEENIDILSDRYVTYAPKNGPPETQTLLDWFLMYSDMFAIGLDDSSPGTEFDSLMFARVGPSLVSLGLATISEVDRTSGVQKIQMSADGHRFITEYRLRSIKIKQEERNSSR